MSWCCSALLLLACCYCFAFSCCWPVTFLCCYCFPLLLLSCCLPACCRFSAARCRCYRFPATRCCFPLLLLLILLLLLCQVQCSYSIFFFVFSFLFPFPHFWKFFLWAFWDVNRLGRVLVDSAMGESGPDSIFSNLAFRCGAFKMIAHMRPSIH